MGSVVGPAEQWETVFQREGINIDDVRANAEAIYARLADGTMPCDGTWPAEDVERFRTWIDHGSPP